MDKIGILNIKLIRGNNKIYNLAFFDTSLDGLDVPIDLTVYDSITMDVKKDKNIDATIIQTYTIGDGLTISGDDDNILEINFERNFTTTNDTQYYYDILFEKDDIFQTLVGGVINITPIVTI